MPNGDFREDCVYLFVLVFPEPEIVSSKTCSHVAFSFILDTSRTNDFTRRDNFLRLLVTRLFCYVFNFSTISSSRCSFMEPKLSLTTISKGEGQNLIFYLVNKFRSHEITTSRCSWHASYELFAMTRIFVHHFVCEFDTRDVFSTWQHISAKHLSGISEDGKYSFKRLQEMSGTWRQSHEIMLLFSSRRGISGRIWELKLSPMIAFGPYGLFRIGNINDINQSSKLRNWTRLILFESILLPMVALGLSRQWFVRFVV